MARIRSSGAVCLIIAMILGACTEDADAPPPSVPDPEAHQLPKEFEAPPHETLPRQPRKRGDGLGFLLHHSTEIVVVTAGKSVETMGTYPSPAEPAEPMRLVSVTVEQTLRGSLALQRTYEVLLSASRSEFPPGTRGVFFLRTAADGRWFGEAAYHLTDSNRLIGLDHTLDSLSARL